MILTPPVCDDEQLLDALDRDGMPYVRISPGKRPGVSPTLSADDGQGVRQLVEHLWTSGRRRFVVIAGPADHAAAMIRERSFAAALAEVGGDPAGISLTRIELHESISESGRLATLDMLRRADPQPDAIFAFNDEVAIGAMAAARELGLSVPEDIAVAGFDDSYIAQLAWPPLTTIHQPIADLAFQAIGVVAGGDSFDASQILLPTRLVVRGTT